MTPMEFDHTVEVRDSRTGQVIKHDPYILRISGAGREYERPPHSGLIYDATGKLIRDEYKEKREKESIEMKAKADAEVQAKADAQAAERKAFLDSVEQEANVLRAQILAQAKEEAAEFKAAPKGK